MSRPGRRRGRRALAAAKVLCTCSLLVLPSTAQLAAQQATADSIRGRSGDDTRSPFVAGAFQWVSGPLLLGYLYAGDIERGLLPGAVMVGGLALVFLNADVVDTDPAAAEGDESLFVLGLIAMIAGSAFSVFDAADAARDHNTRLATAAAALKLVPTRSGFELAVALPLG